MGDRLTEHDLTVASRHKPEAEGLADTDTEWWLGQIAVPKSSAATPRTGSMPTYRRGWTFKIDDLMDFEMRKFRADNGTDAIAIVIRGESEDFLAGWFRASREREVRETIAQLNNELDEERFRCRTDEAVILETGSEFAPDAPFGHESTDISRDGRLSYVRRNRGVTVRRTGHVPSAFAASLLDALARSPFPAPVQERFVPNSISRLAATGTRRGSVLLDIDAAASIPYRGVAQPMRELAIALRNDDASTLKTMNYEPTALPWERT